jgi:hypothetical protein
MSLDDLYRHFEVKEHPQKTVIIRNLGKEFADRPRESIRPSNDPVVTFFQDELDYVETGRSKMQIMHSHSLLCHTYDLKQVDYPHTMPSMAQLDEVHAPVPVSADHGVFKVFHSPDLTTDANVKRPLQSPDKEHVPVEKVKILAKVTSPL